MIIDPIPKKAGHKAVAAVWKWDAERNRRRLIQVCYEPISRSGDVGSPAPARGRGLIAAEQGQLL